jgi:hypothetical protein
MTSPGRTGEASIAVRVLEDPERGPVSPQGPLRSVQEAEISLDRSQLEQMWREEFLQRFARGYWRHLQRISLRLVRTVDAPDSTAVVLGIRQLTLLRFHLPEFEFGPEAGRVTWRIERGILVARQGRGQGYLRFELRLPAPSSGDARIRVRAEVANYYPFLRGSGWFSRAGAWIYAQTQLRLHVLVTRGYLRSLQRV